MSALYPDGTQPHYGEWRVSPLDDPCRILRELKTALSQMTVCVTGGPLAARRVRAHGTTRLGTLRIARREFFLRRYLTGCGQ